MRLHIRKISGAKRSRDGWIMIEMMVALIILGILLVALGRIQYQIQRFNAVQLARMRCIAAAQAELDSITARGEGIDDAELARLWPDVRLEVEQSDGEADWTGLKLVKVSAVGKSNGPEVRVELTRYVGVK